MSQKASGRSAQSFVVGAAMLLTATASLVHVPPAWAQGITTGSIIGTAVDPSGAIVPNATVTAVRPDTGVKETQTTDAKGEFSFRNLTVGSYLLSVEAAGFTKKEEHANVAAGQITDAGALSLALGSSSTVVEVSAASSPILQTTESQVSTIFAAVETEDLPLSGNLDNIALFTPGVALGHDNSFSNSNGNNLSINGQRPRSNNYEIDGQSNNDNSIAGPQIFFRNQDALQEIQTITSNFNAEYGRNMGGVINYITKSGTNRFHGSGYEFYTGNFLQSENNAEKQAGTGLPRYVDNRYGGTFGGPVFKDKVWFFGGTNWERRRQGFTPLNPANNTPTQAGLQQLNQAFPNNPAVLALLKAGPYSLPGTKIAPNATTKITAVTGPGGATVQIPFAKVISSVAPAYNDQEDLGRLDWQPEAKDHFFIRYIYQTSVSNGSQQSNGYFYDIPGATHSIGADWAHTFTATWVNQLRYSFQQSKLFFQGGTQPDCASTSLSTCVASVNISGSLGFGYANNLPQGRTVKVTQVQDNANWTHGNHSISFGGDFTYQNSPNVFLPSYNGSYVFTSFSNFIQGNGNLTLGNGSPIIPFTEPDFGLYVQDDWKVAPSFTFNLGFRYEFYDQAVNTLHNETVARETGPNPFWDTTLPLAQRTYPYTNRNWKNLQPRFGFAYNPQSMRKLVLRGAYGIQYDPSFYNIFLNSATAAPVINLGTITCSGDCLPGGGAITGADVRALNLPKIPTGVNPNSRNQTNNPTTFVNPRAQTYSLGMQYEIHAAVVGVSYVGNHTSKQFQTLNGNPNLLAVAQAFPNVISPATLCQTAGAPGVGHLNCNAVNIRTRANTSFSNYNSLQAQLKTRAYHGLVMDASYTYSRVIDNVDEIFGGSSPAGTVSSPAFAQNPLDTNLAERGVANFSYPNLASVALVYQIPAYKTQNGLLGRLLGGFEVSTGWDYNNGEPWTATQSYAASTFTDRSANSAMNTQSYCDQGFNIAFIGLDACRPVLVNAAAPTSSVGIYVVDPTRAITSNGTGYYNYQSTDANRHLNQSIAPNQVHWLYNNRAYANLVGNPFPGAPRNITRGQSYNNLDAAVVKTVNITEGIGVKLYLNGLNVLNRSFLGTPDTFIEDATFASAINNPGNQRSFQLGGKVIF